MAIKKLYTVSVGALVEYIGGYGNDASREAIKDFDLDAALKDAGY